MSQDAQPEAQALAARLMAAAEAITSGVAILDPEHRLVYFNRRFHDHCSPNFRLTLRLGERFEDIVRSALARGPLYHAEMGEGMHERLAQLRRGSQSDLDLRLVDGRWLRVRESALPDGGRVILTTDITDRKEVQRRLQESEQRLRVLAEALPVVVVSLDEAEILYASPPLVDLVGVGLDTAIGASVQRFWPDPAAWASLLAELRGGGLVNAVETRLRRADGGVFWAELTARRIDYQGQDAVVIGITDLADRKRAEAMDQLLRAVIDAVPAVIHVKDRELRYRLANKYYLDQWNLRAEDLIGFTQKEVFADRLAFAWSGATDARDQRVVAGGEPTGFYQVSVPVKGDGEMVLWANKAPLVDEDGQVTHILTVGTDITEFKRAEAEIARQRDALHQSEKLNALGSILASVAHELNNPLSVVVGYATMLAEHAADAATRERAERVRGAAERCTRIVRTFLAMARHEPSTPAPIRLAEPIEAALEVVDYGLRSGGIEVTLDLAADLPEVQGDGDQLTLVLMNLLLNAQGALQSTPPPRRVVVRTRAEEDAVVLEVADNGPGVASEVVGRIFEPFFTTKPSGTGTGIGLSVCRNIVTSHGGTIGVENQAAGGALFRVRLPAVTTTQPEGGDQVVHEAARRRARILVVDDEPEVRQMLVEILEHGGHEVITAKSGRDALTMLDRQPVDLIISDLRMPDLDGPALHEALQRERPELVARLVFMTGASLAEDLDAFLERSGAEVIEKPFSPHELIRRVQAWLAADRGGRLDTRAPHP